MYIYRYTHICTYIHTYIHGELAHTHSRSQHQHAGLQHLSLRCPQFAYNTHALNIVHVYIYIYIYIIFDMNNGKFTH